MEARISFLTRRRSGTTVSRDHDVVCEVLRFGRSTENEVQLPDPRVPLYHGSLHLRGGGLFFEGANQANTLIDGKLTRTAHVDVGARMELGPYEVIVIAPAPEKDVTVTVELVRPLAEGIDRLKARSCTTLADAGLGKRRAAWAFTIVILALFLAWPVAYHLWSPSMAPEDMTPMRAAEMQEAAWWPLMPTLAWNSGEISGPHRFIAHSCATCHQQAFTMVEDRACVACHTDIRLHADPAKTSFAEVLQVRCESCHKEHVGPRPIARSDQNFCGGCHGRLAEASGNGALLNATDFSKNHPQFRPSVVVDGATGKRERVALDRNRWPVEHSNLTFPHDRHLKADGLRVPGQDARKVLECRDCHRPEPGGVGMTKITMEQHCSSCHRLQFEPLAPQRVVPHAQPAVVARALVEFYADMALRGGAEFPEAPPSVRRRPGSPLSEPARHEALAWAEEKAASTADFVFSKGVCNGCHEVSRAETGGGSPWQVKKVTIADRWMPKGLFHHRHHETLACTTCHQAPTSQSAKDVLLPGIEVCRACHGGEKAANRVPTTCIVCHMFHQPHLGPMRPEFAKAP
ncbi:MAG: hypothetical protein EXQ86_03660 [Rhodospirillales bacterium]|nr:hypothetical protein [Rhodospirillales bacterium]